MIADTTTPPTTVLPTAVLPSQQQQPQQQPQEQQRTMNYRSSIFPRRLYEMLENAEKYGYAQMISWMPDGRSFRIDTDHYDKAEIVALLTRCHFKQSKFKSFTKQLILYSFQRLKKNHYSHNLMVRGRPDLFFRKSRREFSLEMKTPTTTTSSMTTKKMTNNATTIPFPPDKIPSSASASTHHDAYHAMISRHSTLSPSVKHMEQYLPSLPLYLPQQEQANFVDRLGDMYSKNDTVDTNNIINQHVHVSSSVVSKENNTDADSLDSSSNGDSSKSSSSDHDDTYDASSSSLFENSRLELLFDEESDYACTMDISTQEQERYNNNNSNYSHINMVHLTEIEKEMLMKM